MFDKTKYLITLFMAMLTAFPAYSDWFVPETGTAGAVYDVVQFQDKLFAASNPNGVYISVNNGTQWLEINNDLPLAAKPAQALTVSGNQVFVGTDSGIYSTSDLGTNWIAKNVGLGNMVVYSLTTSDNNLYAVTDDAGAYYSTNNGTDWYPMNNGDIIGMIFYTIEVADGKAYVGAQDGHIYTTTNRGQEWIDIRSGPLVFAVKTIAVSGSKILAGTPVGVFYSDNGGTNWRAINAGFKNSDITDVAFQGNLFVASTKGGGVYISNNEGQSWVPVNVGLPDMNVLCLAFTNSDIFAGSQYASVARRSLSELVVPPVVAPTLKSPANNEKHVNYETSFSWNDVVGTKSYSWRIALSTDFSNTLINKDNIQTSNFTQTLEKGLTYYWQVASIASDDSKMWSEVWSFTTREDLTKPDLVEPPNQSASVKNPIVFVWRPAKGIVSYKLQISTNMDFLDNFILNQVNIVDTSFTYDQLKVDSSYYWRVRAVAIDDSELGSDTWSFKVAPTSVSDFVTEPAYVEMFPNPVTESNVTIKFNFDAVNSLVDILTIDGKPVSKLYTGDIETGMSITANLENANLSSGVYLIRISSESRNIIKKLIIK